MAHRRKRGRPKKLGPRTASGQNSRAYVTVARDFGTLELQDKRRALVAEGADPDLSATAVGILHSHGHLDREQYEIALRYATLKCAVYGTRWPKNGSGREITEEHAIRIKRALAAMLAKLSPYQESIIDRTAMPEGERPIHGTSCVGQTWQPQWFQSMRLGLPLLPEDVAERHALLAGLDALLDRLTVTAVAA